MSEWQPIETAPRDGTEVLTFGKHGTSVLFWDDEYAAEKCWREKSAWLALRDEPTHWMPLPPAPEGK